MAATQWPIETVDLSDLILDPRNVRVRAGRGDGLADSDRLVAEQAIAKYMVEAEALLDLVRDILRDGYLDNEIPVVVAGDGGWVVLEGNRRISSLKVIADPGLLGSRASQVGKLVGRYPDHDTPTSVRVMIAPSRQDAQPLLARLHTGHPKKGWLREQQAIFFHSQLVDGVTVDDLRVAYPGEARTIPRFIFMGEMRDVIRGLRYEDPALREYVMNSELKMTGFEYAYRPTQLRAALGLEVTRDGLLVNKKMTTGQRKALIYLLSRFKERTLNTRSLELIAKHPEHAEFAELLRRIVAGEEAEPGGREAVGRQGGDDPSGSDGGQRGRNGRAGGQGAASPATAGGVPGAAGPVPDGGAYGGSHRNANRGDTRSRLAMDGFEYRGTSGGMRRRLEELGRIDVRDFPNAAHDLLRTVLECAIKDFFRTAGKPLGPKITLGPAITALAGEFRGDPKMTTHINDINRKGSMKTEQYVGTAESLNAGNHEPDSFSEPRDAHAAWERLKPILIEIVGTKRP